MDKFWKTVEQFLREVVKEATKEAYKEATEEHRRYGEVVDVKGASEITGLSTNTLYQLHSRGRVPGARKVGSRLVFRVEDLRKWVDDGGVTVRKIYYEPF